MAGRCVGVVVLIGSLSARDGTRPEARNLHENSVGGAKWVSPDRQVWVRCDRIL